MSVEAVPKESGIVKAQGGGWTTKTFIIEYCDGWKSNSLKSSSSEIASVTVAVTGTSGTCSLSGDGSAYISAIPNEGYYWNGWFADASGNSKLTNLTRETNFTIKNGYNLMGSNATSGDQKYYAIFKPVTVNSVSADYTTIQTVDVNGSMTANITFGVTGADNMNDFLSDNVTYTTTDSRFAVGAATVNSSAGTVTVSVTYTDDNHHIMDDALPQITLALTSKGNVSSTKSITIYAKSNLYPEFTATPSPCDLTPDNPVDDGQTVSATITTSYSKIATGNANNVWTAEFVNPDEAASLGYSLDKTDPKNPKVSFTPTAQSINKVNV